MSDRRSYIFSRQFFRHAFILSTGTSLASVLAILLQPVLRRMYPPEAFGAFSIYLGLAGILVVVATLKYDQTIVLPDKDENANELVLLSLGLSFLFNSLILILIILWSDWLIKLIGFPGDQKRWLLLIPASALLFSSFNVFNFWLLRKKRFMRSSICKISRRAVEGGAQVGMGLNPGSAAGLYIGDLAGHLVNLSLGIRFSRRSGLNLSGVKWKGIATVAKRYRDFAIYNTIPTLFNTLTLALPLFLVNRFYNESVTGQLDLARLVLFLPLVLISEPIAQVYFQHTSERIKQRLPVFPVTIKLILVLSVCAGSGLILVRLWAGGFTTFIFGPEWLPAGQYMRILVFSIALRFVIDPIRFVFSVTRKIKVLSAWQILYFAMIGSLVFFNGIGIERFLGFFVVLESISYIILFLLTLVVIRSYDGTLPQQG